MRNSGRAQTPAKQWRRFLRWTVVLAAAAFAGPVAGVAQAADLAETAGNADGSAIQNSNLIGPIVAARPGAPGNLTPPQISGTYAAGQVLTEGGDTWSNNPTSFSYQWLRCTGGDCKKISNGGTDRAYTIKPADVGHALEVTVTAKNPSGSTKATSAPTPAIGSAAPGPVDPGPGPVNPGPGPVNPGVSPPRANPGSTPSISGAGQVGSTLTASGAQFAGNPGTFSYQWLRCNAAAGCVAISGANGTTYTPGSPDLGQTIAVAETASNSGGTSGTVVSPRTSTITAPSTTAVQANSAAPVAGQTVTIVATVTPAVSSVKPTGTIDFDSNGTAIRGCTDVALGSAAPTALCQTSFPAAVANVTATYSAAPGTFITGSASSPATITVARAATTVTVGPGRVPLGKKATYTATVHPPAGSTLTPTGRVAFTDGGKGIKGCGAKTLTAGRARCSVTYVTIKQHRISVRYSGDANFSPSGSLTSHVRVQPQAPKGFVAAVMYWSFRYTPHSTRVKSLTATGLSAGMHITLTCRGGGCPFATHAIAVVAHGKCGKPAKTGCVAAPSFNFTSMLHRAPLHVGTQLIVAVTHRGWVGKYYSFTIRAGRRPATEVSCLAVNGTRPGVGCSAR